ncbi:MAG: 3-phosphoshikimate 1-carboxyvinyltransferase [Flavobacteriales bacterium]|nr:3-phosphoshikimate 1-carboxyvinyltransferase [Flavobacteriales bacterium]
MLLDLTHKNGQIKGKINLTASKSESNRALIIRALCSEYFDIQSLSEAEDTQLMKSLVTLLDMIGESDVDFRKPENEDENPQVLSASNAGTVMRFLTAFLSIKKGFWVLTGEDRMNERPIHELVQALQGLGADIEYLEQFGFPPIQIIGKPLRGGKVTMQGNVSSQFITALLLIAPELSGGLELELQGEVVSRPYIEMTINMMRYFGVDVSWEGNTILVKAGNYQARPIQIEADWSSVSYWYGFAAIANEVDLELKGLKKDSLQGDAVVAEIYKQFGVETTFTAEGIRVRKICPPELIEGTNFEYDFTNCPDLAQTVAVTCAALNIPAKFTGLKSLRIKETDRIAALQTELNKLGFDAEVEGDDLVIHASLRMPDSSGMKQSSDVQIASGHSMPFAKTKPTINTYRDHRMAMAFAPLALLQPIHIENAGVVKKSYPNFWEDVKLL